MSTIARLSGLLALVAAIPVAAGCSVTSQASADEDPATNDAAVSAANQHCGPGKYNEALVHYKAAVAKAKQHKTDACMEDAGGSATVAEVASEAQKAVTACGAFQNVIKTSPWAGDLRAALSGTFIYPILTGDLDPSSSRSLSTALVGVTMFGPAPGVYGNVGRLTFEASGRGFMGILNLSDDGDVSWGRTDVRWSVEDRGGAVAIKVVAELDDATEKTYEYLLKKDAFLGADNYRLELQNDPDAPGAYQMFDTFPSECEA